MQAERSILLLNYLCAVGWCAFQRDSKAWGHVPFCSPASLLPCLSWQTRNVLLQRTADLTGSPTHLPQVSGSGGRLEQDGLCITSTGVLRTEELLHSWWLQYWAAKWYTSPQHKRVGKAHFLHIQTAQNTHTHIIPVHSGGWDGPVCWEKGQTGTILFKEPLLFFPT